MKICLIIGKSEYINLIQKCLGQKKRTILEEVECGVNGFAVPTFNDTLDDITDEAYNIQE